MRIYSIVLVGAKSLLIHVVEALPDHQVSSGTTLICHKHSPTKAYAKFPGHLDPALHERWGSTRPPHKISDAAPYQTKGSKTCCQVSKDSKGLTHQDSKVRRRFTFHAYILRPIKTICLENLRHITRNKK